MVYELIEHDEMDLALCVYEFIKEQLIAEKPILLRPLASHCGVSIPDIEDRIKLIYIIELRTRIELGLPKE